MAAVVLDFRPIILLGILGRANETLVELDAEMLRWGEADMGRRIRLLHEIEQKRTGDLGWEGVIYFCYAK